MLAGWVAGEIVVTVETADLLHPSFDKARFVVRLATAADVREARRTPSAARLTG